MANGAGALVELPQAVWYSHIALAGMSSIGMAFHVRLARIAFTCLMAISVLFAFVGGVGVASPVAMGIGLLVALADGALLASAYLAPASEKFK
jgi:hypothetical protein